MTDDSQRSLELRPGIIRQCTTIDKKWVVVDSMHWRWMDSKFVSESTSPSKLSENTSTVIGLLPPDELDSTVWCDRYTISKPCINNPRVYEPVWDPDGLFGGRWLSHSTSSDRLYDLTGRFVSVGVPPATQAIEPKEKGLMKDIDRLKPGIIRQCPSGKGDKHHRRWVMVDKTTWRWMDNEYTATCSTLSDDPSDVVGLLPPGELNATVWREAYALPYPCIKNAKEYEPHWDDSVAGRWLSKHIESGCLFDMNGSTVIPEPAQQSFASATVRFFKKYW